MKNKIFKSALAIATGGFLLLSSGCKKLEDFGDTNVNPLGSTDPITAALLTNVESQMGALAQSIRPALYVQYISETQYTETSYTRSLNSTLAVLIQVRCMICNRSLTGTVGRMLPSMQFLVQLETKLL